MMPANRKNNLSPVSKVTQEASDKQTINNDNIVSITIKMLELAQHMITTIPAHVLESRTYLTKTAFYSSVYP